MSCFENLNLPPCVWFQGDEKRNAVASLLSGALFFIAWWIVIDANITSFKDFNGAYHLCGIFGTLSLFMVNSVSNALLRGDGYDGGCMGQQGAKIWLFLGFLTGFAAVFAATWILFANFVAVQSEPRPEQWAGVGLFLQNVFIFIASLMFKFGRVEDQSWSAW